MRTDTAFGQEQTTRVIFSSPVGTSPRLRSAPCAPAHQRKGRWSLEKKAASADYVDEVVRVESSSGRNRPRRLMLSQPVLRALPH